ncbi:hypothetical protein DACRYDRAFT_23636 [Dacryopinax primogenitus]|uniref:Uncharacterized protein n=1 Tax=Dacryopinax primogenitus (strain DJM 731) TaxID=1858805 RepID=M5G6X9_DACPD|nr:uncharacterized protein DACRYDRAFT_23636 [Dacryopinax primogenitus]EJT99512.1 hypothetical protein DACRYDRAFT_23636 [Dacryopinax primogenitus]
MLEFAPPLSASPSQQQLGAPRHSPSTSTLSTVSLGSLRRQPSDRQRSGTIRSSTGTVPRGSLDAQRAIEARFDSSLAVLSPADQVAGTGNVPPPPPPPPPPPGPSGISRLRPVQPLDPFALDEESYERPRPGAGSSQELVVGRLEPEEQDQERPVRQARAVRGSRADRETREPEREREGKGWRRVPTE